MPAVPARQPGTHTFVVTWEPETRAWGVVQADRDDVYTQGDTLAEARHHAVEALALVDDIDEVDVGPVRFVVDGPIEIA